MAADSRLLAGRLPNGLSYCVRGNENLVPPNRLLLRLVVGAGAVHEDAGQRGVAHFVEHMAFEGTAHFPKAELTRFIRRLGMTIGPDASAWTGPDYTAYSISVPSDDADAVSQGLSYLRDVASSIRFEPAGIELERRVLVEEWRTRQSVDARVEEARFALPFTGSAYAGHALGATPAEITRTTRESLLRYYRDWYRPDSMAVLAVGAPKPELLATAIARVFSGLPTPAPPRPALVRHTPPHERLLVRVFSDPELEVPTVTFFAQAEHGLPATEAELRTELEERLALSMLAQRLGYARIAHASFHATETAVLQPTRDLRLLMFGGRLPEDAVEGGLRSLFVELASASRYGFRSQELAQAMQAMAADFDRNRDPNEVQTIDEMAEELQLSFRTGTPYHDQAQLDAKSRELLPKLSLKDVNERVRAHASPRGWSVFVAAPSGVALPTEAELRDWAQLALLAPPPPPAPRINRPIVVNVRQPGSVLATTTDATLGTTMLQLSNGVGVVLKQVPLTGEAVLIRGFLRGGTAQLSDEDFAQARFAEELAKAAGAGGYERHELQHALTEAGSSVDINLSQSWRSVRIDTTTTGLTTALRVAHLQLTQPQRSPDAFTEWRANTQRWLDRSNPPSDSIFWTTVEDLTNDDEPRSTWLRNSDLSRVDEQAAFSIWKRQFSDFNGATFFVLGNVELSEVRNLAEKYLATLPSGDELVTLKIPALQYPVGKVERSVDAGSEPRSRVVLQLMAPDPFSTELETDLEIFQEVFYARVLEVLRGELGGVYAPYVWAWEKREPEPHHALRISFECAPENVDHLTQAVFDELQALGRNGIGAQYLAPLKTQLQRKREAHLYSSGWWLATLARVYLYGDSFPLITDTPAALQRITSPNIAATARRLFDPNNYVRVVSRPSHALMPP